MLSDFKKEACLEFSISNGDFYLFFDCEIFYLFRTEISSRIPSGVVTATLSGCLGFLALLGYAGAARPSRLCLLLVISVVVIRLIFFLERFFYFHRNFFLVYKKTLRQGRNNCILVVRYELISDLPFPTLNLTF